MSKDFMDYDLIRCVNRDRNRRHPNFLLGCSPEMSGYHERVPTSEGVVWVPLFFIDNDLFSPLNLSACRRRGRSNKALSHKKSCTLALSNCLALSRRFSPFYPSTSYCTTIFSVCTDNIYLTSRLSPWSHVRTLSTYLIPTILSSYPRSGGTNIFSRH